MTAPMQPVGRPQDAYPHERDARTAVWRVATIVSVSGDGKRLTVSVPGGGQLSNVMMTADVTATVGARVAVMYDQDTALAFGMMK